MRLTLSCPVLLVLELLSFVKLQLLPQHGQVIVFCQQRRLGFLQGVPEMLCILRGQGLNEGCEN